MNLSRDKRHSVKRVVLTGLLFHLAFLTSTYYCSPIQSLVHGVQSHGPERGDANHLAHANVDKSNASLLFLLDAAAPGASDAAVSSIHSGVRITSAPRHNHSVPRRGRNGKSLATFSHGPRWHHLFAGAAYLGWIAYGITAIFLPDAFASAQPSLLIDIAASSALSASFYGLYVHGASASCYLYIPFPIYFWRHTLNTTGHALFSVSTSSFVGPCWRGTLLVRALQILGLAYTHNHLWSTGLIVMGVAWPLLGWPDRALRRHGALLASWMIACLTTAAFPLFDVEKDVALPLTMLSGMGVLLIGLVVVATAFSFNKKVESSTNKYMRSTFLTQMALVLGSMVIRATSEMSTVHQIAGWTLLTAATVFPFLKDQAETTSFSRLGSIFMAFSAPSILLSSGSESLFYVVFSTLLVLWTKVECIVRAYQISDAKIGLFGLFFGQLAFFGTGNAAMSSDHLEMLNRLAPSFHPCLVMTLLCLKVSAPYIMLSACLAMLNGRLRITPSKLLLIALIMSDVMSLSFFLNGVRAGSSLDVKTSATDFITSQVLLLISTAVGSLGGFLIKDTLHPKTLGASTPALPCENKVKPRLVSNTIN